MHASSSYQVVYINDFIMIIQMRSLVSIETPRAGKQDDWNLAIRPGLNVVPGRPRFYSPEGGI